MKILDYIIPSHLQDSAFITSLNTQFNLNGKLSKKQINVLRDMLEIDEEYDDDIFEGDTCEYYSKYLEKLRSKLKRNRFKSLTKKNECIRCIYDILNGEPSEEMIIKALNMDYKIYNNKIYRRA